MKYVELSESLEVIAVYPFEVPNCIRIPNDLYVTIRFDDGTIVQPGTIFTQEEIDYYCDLFDEKDAIRDKIRSEILPLIGRSVLSLTDGERWKMFGVVLFRLGIISSNGIIKPFDEWLDL